jgi:monofunctional biosynthetic peptidoglycan transglycosylase
MEQRLREAERAGTSLDVHKTWVPLPEVSRHLVRAVIVAEDYRFRQHRGVDWVSLAEEVRWTGDDRFSWTSAADLGALKKALGYVWSARDEIRGRSTITQQLAKNLYFGTDRTLLRKAMEFVVAGRLERRLGKDRILELYLNVVEWGPGVFGAEAAADAYFGTTAAALTLDQAAALAATLPHPLTSNPAHRPGRMLWRKNLILSRIDPASGIPASPMPLPEPEVGVSDTIPLDTLIVSPDFAIVSPDTAVISPDSTLVPIDTLSVPGDSAVSRDTLAVPGDARR